MNQSNTIIPSPTKAEHFAALAHAGQRYNDEMPYTAHLLFVVDVLKRFGITDPVMVCAAWLHDSIEDTNTSYNDIKKRFGIEVAELVYAVTSELGRNRKERNEKTYPKIRDNIPATILKLADRIANVEYGAATGGKNDMYSKEFNDFYQGLNGPKHIIDNIEPLVKMWKHLQKLL